MPPIYTAFITNRRDLCRTKITKYGKSLIQSMLFIFAARKTK